MNLESDAPCLRLGIAVIKVVGCFFNLFVPPSLHTIISPLPFPFCTMYQASHYQISPLEQMAVAPSFPAARYEMARQQYALHSYSFGGSGDGFGHYGSPLLFSSMNHSNHQYHHYQFDTSRHGGSYESPFLGQAHQEYHFQPDDFLLPGRGGRFVGEAGQVKEFVEEAFSAVFGRIFPSDIKVSVLEEREFRKLAPNPATVGFSLNRSVQGLLSEVFVLQDSLGKVMLTIGHELGHVLSPPLGNPHDEEAKAYAFSLVWMKAIQEKNIAGLGNSFISDLPAENGLHNVAFRWVQGLVRKGMDFWELYREILAGRMGVVM